MPRRALFTVFTDETATQQTQQPTHKSRSRRRIDDDKENADDSAIAVTPRAKPHFSTAHFSKAPFSLASPPTDAKEAAEQRLGLGMTDGNAERITTLGRKHGRQLSDKLKQEFAADAPYSDAPLAVVTEAYTGQNGFHLSPTTRSQPTITSPTVSRKQPVSLA